MPITEHLLAESQAIQAHLRFTKYRRGVPYRLATSRSGIISSVQIPLDLVVSHSGRTLCCRFCCRYLVGMPAQGRTRDLGTISAQFRRIRPRSLALENPDFVRSTVRSRLGMTVQVGVSVGVASPEAQSLDLEDPIGAVHCCAVDVGTCRRGKSAQVRTFVMCRLVSRFVVGVGGKTGADQPRGLLHHCCAGSASRLWLPALFLRAQSVVLIFKFTQSIGCTPHDGTYSAAYRA